MAITPAVKVTISVLVVVLGFIITSCGAVDGWWISYNGSLRHFTDLANPSGTEKCSISTGTWNAGDFKGGKTDMIYAFNSDDSTLYTISTEDCSVTKIGTVETPYDIKGLSWSFSEGVMYSVYRSATASYLGTINLETAVVTPVATVNGCLVDDIAVVGDKVYGFDQLYWYALFELYPSSHDFGSFPGSFNLPIGMSCDADSGAVYFISYNIMEAANQLRQFNIGTDSADSDLVASVYTEGDCLCFGVHTSQSESLSSSTSHSLSSSSSASISTSSSSNSLSLSSSGSTSQSLSSSGSTSQSLSSSTSASKSLSSSTSASASASISSSISASTAESLSTSKSRSSSGSASGVVSLSNSDSGAESLSESASVSLLSSSSTPSSRSYASDSSKSRSTSTTSPLSSGSSSRSQSNSITESSIPSSSTSTSTQSLQSTSNSRADSHSEPESESESESEIESESTSMARSTSTSTSMSMLSSSTTTIKSTSSSRSHSGSSESQSHHHSSSSESESMATSESISGVPSLLGPPPVLLLFALVALFL
ncbi:hypothetical protein Pelo_17004 [Pelomyxa schiedti]|nr:hypothetical protein Pelo_17004 [Pelomyxa schiedti]